MTLPKERFQAYRTLKNDIWRADLASIPQASRPSGLRGEGPDERRGQAGHALDAGRPAAQGPAQRRAAGAARERGARSLPRRCARSAANSWNASRMRARTARASSLASFACTDTACSGVPAVYPSYRLLAHRGRDLFMGSNHRATSPRSIYCCIRLGMHLERSCMRGGTDVVGAVGVCTDCHAPLHAACNS